MDSRRPSNKGRGSRRASTSTPLQTYDEEQNRDDGLRILDMGDSGSSDVTMSSSPSLFQQLHHEYAPEAAGSNDNKLRPHALLPIQESSSDRMLSGGSVDAAGSMDEAATPPASPPASPPSSPASPPRASISIEIRSPGPTPVRAGHDEGADGEVAGTVPADGHGDDMGVIDAEDNHIMLAKSKLTLRQARRKMMGIGKVAMMMAMQPAKETPDAQADRIEPEAPTTGRRSVKVNPEISLASGLLAASLKEYGASATTTSSSSSTSGAMTSNGSSSGHTSTITTGSTPLKGSTFARLAQLAVANAGNSSSSPSASPTLTPASPHATAALSTSSSSGSAQQLVERSIGGEKAFAGGGGGPSTVRSSITTAGGSSSGGNNSTNTAARRKSSVVLSPGSTGTVIRSSIHDGARRTSMGGGDPNKRRQSTNNATNSTAHNNNTSTSSTKSTAIKQKFTVTEEILRQIKSNNRASHKGSNVWSPRAWQRGTGSSLKSSLMDTEGLVNAYVELVCDDLKTNERRRLSADEEEPWVIDPGALWRVRWDMMMLVLVIWTSYSVPYRTAFHSNPTPGEEGLDLCIDIIFLMDIVLNLFTAYYESEGIIQTDLKKIMKRYIKGWFFLDLISSIPANFQSGQSSLEKLFLGLKFMKLLRLVRLRRYMDSKEVAMFFTPSMLRLANTLMFLTWVWHVITCLYWYISSSEGLGSSAWVMPLEHAHKSDILNYFLSFCWTVQTTFSISPYDPPETLPEAIFTIFCYLIGIFMNAYVIGSAGSALQSLDQDKAEQRQLMDRIITYMKKRQLPSYFQRIILDFYNYTSAKHSEEGILTDLPPAIQLRLSLLLNRELVKNIPIVKQLELNTIIGLMQTLQSTMYMPGEHVIKIGEKGEHLYFVKTGQLEITLDNINVVSNLQKGDMFGQVALTTDGNHDFNVRAAVYSEVLSLNREAYDDLSAESEKFMELVEMEAIKQEQFIVKAQKNLKRMAKMARFGGNNRQQPSGDAAAGGGAGARRTSPRGRGEEGGDDDEEGGGRGRGSPTEGAGFENRGGNRPSVKSIQKAKMVSGIVGMFKKTNSSKVTPKV